MSDRRTVRSWSSSRALLLLVLLGAPARGDEPPPRTALVPVFTISKSSNKNQVQYAIRVDAQCAPAGSTPVIAYWKMLETGPAATAPLLEREVPAYGTATEQVLPAAGGAGQVRITLNAVPDRALVVETFRQSGRCFALATTTIGGAPAHLFDVYVRLNWMSQVKYLLLEGWSMDGKAVVREMLER